MERQQEQNGRGSGFKVRDLMEQGRHRGEEEWMVIDWLLIEGRLGVEGRVGWRMRRPVIRFWRASVLYNMIILKSFYLFPNFCFIIEGFSLNDQAFLLDCSRHEFPEQKYTIPH